jgi:uncharacterized protein (DUF488 family)
MAQPTIYTIGHSTHEWRDFVRLLTVHEIGAIADVRSVPASRLPYFNREALRESLPNAGVDYVFLGNELGARRAEPECYAGDIAVYENIAKLTQFQQGIAEVLQRGSQRRVCLMCAEKEPLDCHRTLLVTRELVRRGATVRHILADGQLEDHAITERRLMKLMGVEQSLFDDDDVLLADAYERRGREIAYRRGDEGEGAPA